MSAALTVFTVLLQYTWLF